MTIDPSTFSPISADYRLIGIDYGHPEGSFTITSTYQPEDEAMPNQQEFLEYEREQLAQRREWHRRRRGEFVVISLTAVANLTIGIWAMVAFKSVGYFAVLGITAFLWFMLFNARWCGWNTDADLSKAIAEQMFDKLSDKSRQTVIDHLKKK